MQFPISNFQFPISKPKLKSIKPFAFLLAVLTFNICLFTLNIPKASAQLSSIGIANYLEITGGKVEDGDIIVASEKGYVISQVIFEPQIVGVVTLKPAVSLKTDGAKRGFPVVSQGTAIAKVTNEGGDIKKGDYVTSSSIPGTGMKADRTGFVLGEAVYNVSFKKKGEIKFATILVNPRQTQIGVGSSNSVFDLLKLGNVAASEKPSQALKYIVATLIIIMTFGCGFLIFAKSVNTGLEALGRNPLAGRQIQLSIVFNIIMIIVIIAVGAGLAYLVIRL